MAEQLGWGRRFSRAVNEQIVQRISNVLGRYDGSTADLSQRQSSDVETREREQAGASSFDWYLEEMRLGSSRFAKYKDYERMDAECVEAISALDVYADNATEGDSDTDEVIMIKSDSELAVDILNEVKERLKLDTEAWAIARELVKYGDKFEEIVVFDDMEIHRLKSLPAKQMYVNVDEYGRLDPEHPYEQKDVAGKSIAKFTDWQILHFKLSRARDEKYGVDGGILFPVRRVFKQMEMMEDALVINRLTRAQQRYAYKIDVTGLEPGEATLEYLREVRKELRKRGTIDPMTGKMDLTYNPLSAEEDVFIGVRDGNGDVSVLQGQTASGLEDINHLRNKFFAGIKLPKAWLGFEEGTRARAVLTEQDVQAARTVRRVQMAMIAGFRKLFDIALMVRGVDPAQIEYTIAMPPISTIDEMREWQIKKIKADLARALKAEMGVSTHWLLVNMLGFTEEQIDEIKEYLFDPESLDNVSFDLQMAKMSTQAQVFAPDDDDDEEEEDRARGASADEQISQRQIRIAQHKLKEDIATLKELLNWEMESKAGRGLWSQKKEVG